MEQYKKEEDLINISLLNNDLAAYTFNYQSLGYIFVYSTKHRVVLVVVDKLLVFWR